MTVTLPLGQQRIALAHLHESPGNPRTITDEALDRLKYSLDQDPQMLEARPLIALATGEVVAGNMRLRAAKALWEAAQTIPVYVADLDAQRKREWLLRDNAGYGEWEDEALAALVAEHAEASGDMALLGLADAEMTALLKLAGETGGAGGRGLGDPDAPPPEPIEPRCEVGDLVLLGDHRLYVGDAATDACIRALFTDRREAHLLLTDPPYGVSYQGKSIYGEPPDEEAPQLVWDAYYAYREHREKLMRRARGSMELTGDEPENLASLIATALGIAPLAIGRSFYVFAPNGAGKVQFIDGLLAAGLAPRHELVWIKDRLALGLQDYHYRHEGILYGWRAGAAHYFTDSRSKDTVLEFAMPRASKMHPTTKPVELIRELVRNSSRRGEIIYDPFAGSGSTLIAAHAEQRLCRAAEIEPIYATAIIGRFEEYTGMEAQIVKPEAINA